MEGRSRLHARACAHGAFLVQTRRFQSWASGELLALAPVTESPVYLCVATDGAPSLLSSFSAGCASLSGTSLTNNTVFNAVPGRGLWGAGGGSSVGEVGVPRSRAESRHSGTSQGACLLPRTGKHEGLAICLAVLRSRSLAPSALALPHRGARCTYYSLQPVHPRESWSVSGILSSWWLSVRD